MIILCRDNEADNSSLKKVHKIIISEYYEDIEESKKVMVINQFYPQIRLVYNFINGYYNKKRFLKKYCKELRTNENIYATIVTLMIMYKKHKDICLVCSSTEYKLGYLQKFCELLENDFGIKYMSFKEWKNGGKKLGKCKINEKKLAKAVFEYKKIIYSDSDYSKNSKKKNHKKKDKKKNKKLKGFYKCTDYKEKDKKKCAIGEGFIIAEKKTRVIHIRKIK